MRVSSGCVLPVALCDILLVILTLVRRFSRMAAGRGGNKMLIH